MHVITVAFNQLKGCTWKFGEQQQKGKRKLWEINVVLGGWDEHWLRQNKKTGNGKSACD